jgi:hypothetical protein
MIIEMEKANGKWLTKWKWKMMNEMQMENYK